MPDSRIIKLADILVNYSLKVKRQEAVMISASSELAKPLVLEVYKKVIEVGAHPTTRIAFEELMNIFFDNASKGQLMNLPKTNL